MKKVTRVEEELIPSGETVTLQVQKLKQHEMK